MSSRQVIAYYLFHLGQEQDKGSWIYDIMSSLPLTTIAELLGLHRVTVTKIINGLKKDGIISMRHHIAIEDANALLAMIRQ
jgi:CRP-like cAMP-binding protein